MGDLELIDEIERLSDELDLLEKQKDSDEEFFSKRETLRIEVMRLTDELLERLEER